MFCCDTRCCELLLQALDLPAGEAASLPGPTIRGIRAIRREAQGAGAGQGSAMPGRGTDWGELGATGQRRQCSRQCSGCCVGERPGRGMGGSGWVGTGSRGYWCVTLCVFTVLLVVLVLSPSSGVSCYVEKLKNSWI
jgi:hypothetical protein